MVLKKRTRKPLDNEDDINMDAVTDLEKEYTETERKLLEIVQKQSTTENFDSDDEVYGLQDESEEEEQEDNQQDLTMNLLLIKLQIYRLCNSILKGSS